MHELRISPTRIGPEGLVALGFLAAAVPAALVLADTVDDEGYLTFLLARIFAQEPIAGLFFLKTRPAISLVYALPAMLGWNAFLLAHVTVAGVSVFWFARTIARLGGHAVAAAATLVLSPVFFHAALSGYSNTDGLAILMLAFDAITRPPTRRNRLWTGLVLAAGFLGRFELTPVFLSLWLFALIHRRDLLIGATTVVAGTAYLLAGALYHADILWPLRFPPAFSMPPAYHEGFFLAHRLSPEHLGLVAARLTAVTPLWLLPLAARIRDVPPVARWLLAGAGISLLLVIAFPSSGGVFWFPHLSRHFLVVLPCAALAAALGPAERRHWGWIFPAVPLALSPWWRWNAALAGPAFLVPALAGLRSGPSRRKLLEGALAFGLAVSSVAAFFAVSFRGDLWRDTRETLAFLRSGAGGRSAIFTNVKGLGPGLDASHHAAPVFFLPNHSILYELKDLTNPANGQRAMVARAVERHLYGKALWPCRLPDDGPRLGDLLILVPDERLDLVFPIQEWVEQSEPLGSHGSIQVRRFTRAPTRTPPRGEFADPVRDYPCATTPRDETSQSFRLSSQERRVRSRTSPASSNGPRQGRSEFIRGSGALPSSHVEGVST